MPDVEVGVLLFPTTCMKPTKQGWTMAISFIEDFLEVAWLCFKLFQSMDGLKMKITVTGTPIFRKTIYGFLQISVKPIHCLIQISWMHNVYNIKT